MNYCKRCNINVGEVRSHCPLCGKCVNEENMSLSLTGIYYPDYSKWRRNRINIFALFTVILLALNALWIVIEFVIFHKLHLTWFFLSSSAVVFLTVIWPFVRQHSFSMRVVIAALSVCAFLFFLEKYTNTTGWGLGVVAPLFLLGNSVAVWAVMLTRGYYLKSTMFPCLFIALMSTAAFFINLLTSYTSLLGIWPSLVAICAGWFFFILLLGIRYRKVVYGLKKDFHI